MLTKPDNSGSLDNINFGFVWCDSWLGKLYAHIPLHTCNIILHTPVNTSPKRTLKKMRMSGMFFYLTKIMLKIELCVRNIVLIKI
jgi:hypothetical protein